MPAADFVTLVLTGSISGGFVSYLLKDYGERGEARRRQLEDLYLNSRKYFTKLHLSLAGQNVLLDGGMNLDTFLASDKKLTEEVEGLLDRLSLGTDLYVPEARSSFKKLMAVYSEAYEVMKTSPLQGVSMKRTQHRLAHDELMKEFDRDRDDYFQVLSDVALSLSRPLPIRFWHWLGQLPRHFCDWIKAKSRKPRVPLPSEESTVGAVKTDDPSSAASPPSPATPGPTV